MKNISILAIFVIILFLFSAFFPVYCEAQSNYSFSIVPHFGFFYGQSREFVYPANTHVDLLSELLWDMKPILYAGLQIEYDLATLKRGPHLYASAAFKFGIPGDSGVLENRDWASMENDALTHFSSHTNETKEFFWLDAAIGVTIPITSSFYIRPFLSGGWMRFAFAARDGYGIYARGKTFDASNNPITFYPIDDNPLEIQYPGREVIRYQQDWFFIAAGINAGIRLSPLFSLDLSFKISPLTYCAAVDEHLTRNITFLDYTGFGLYLEPGFRVSLTIENIDFSLEGAYRYIGRTKGPSYRRIGDIGNFRQNGEAGAGLSIADVRFLVRFRF
jgi:outer membrane protease